MSQKLLYQYQRADGVLLLKAVSFFDNDTGLPLKDVLQFSEAHGTGAIGLFTTGGWQSLSIGVELTAEVDILRELVPKGKKYTASTSAVIAMSSPSAKYRRGVKLDWKEHGKWIGTIEVRRSDVSGEILLRPMVIRSKDEAPVAGFACFAGAILATGADIKLLLTDKGPPPSGDFGYKWKDFRDSDIISALKGRGDDVFFIAPDGRPLVYINIRWPGLKQVLENKAVTGTPAALRRCFRSVIGQAGWLQMLVTAVGSIRENADGNYEVVGDAWRAPLARWVASRLYPDMDSQHQLKSLAVAFRDPSEVGMVVARMQSLAHDKTNIGKDLDIAARLVDADQSGEPEVEE